MKKILLVLLVLLLCGCAAANSSDATVSSTRETEISSREDTEAEEPEAEESEAEETEAEEPEAEEPEAEESEAEEPEAEEPEAEEPETGESEEEEETETEAFSLPEGLTDEEKLAYINSHSALYPSRLLNFLDKYPQTLDYVYYYPVLYGTSVEIDLSQEASGDTVPLLIQWDARWGYEPYGTGLIGYTGCGPVCLSMVALYLTGDATYTPVYVANYADSHGYYVKGSGTAWSLMSSGCRAFGITATTLSVSESAMISALESGMPIICSVRPGDFTYTGHFIVITGYADGAFTVNDPNSVENSSRTWTYSELKDQIKCMWAYRLS